MKYPCARCTTGTYDIPTGCLCEDCEREVDGMTQAQLDVDYARYSRSKKQRKAATR